MVLPGHPRSDGTPQNPCLSPERWQAILDRGIRELEEVVAHYDADGANFLDGNPKQLLPGLYYLGDYEGHAIYSLRAGERLFLFDAPRGPGLVSFVESRLRQAGLTAARPTAVLLTSCGPESTAGLKALVTRFGCEVVAARAGLSAIQAACPRGTVIRSEDDLSAASWFPVRALPLAGRGQAPLAYEVKWRGKTVLLSGRIPVKVSPRAVMELLRALTEPGNDTRQYVQSLRRLEGLKPDLWLPSVPVDGQNANLYGRAWAETLSDNQAAVQRGVMSGWVRPDTEAPTASNPSNR
ncbi:MAG TPA: hypothetical protein VKI65_19395, partial [Gemmataceae bacterium]|nr:hypothetical protein [Gemmataceae bacterium]